MPSKKNHPLVASQHIAELEKLTETEYCEFSVIENKLAILYRNQNKIYRLLQKVLYKLENK